MKKWPEDAQSDGPRTAQPAARVETPATPEPAGHQDEATVSDTAPDTGAIADAGQPASGDAADAPDSVDGVGAEGAVAGEAQEDAADGRIAEAAVDAGIADAAATRATAVDNPEGEAPAASEETPAASADPSAGAPSGAAATAPDAEKTRAASEEPPAHCADAPAHDPANPPAHEPPDVTVRPAPVPSAGAAPAEPAAAPPPDADRDDRPVFVDASGRRGRRFRRLGMGVAVACAGYGAVIAATLLSGNSTAPWLPVPGQGDDKPAGQVHVSPRPSASSVPSLSGPGAVTGTGLPASPGATAVRDGGSLGPTPGGPKVAASGTGAPSAPTDSPSATAPSPGASPTPSASGGATSPAPTSSPTRARRTPPGRARHSHVPLPL
ncbi:hypothetical protein AB0D42_06950 [Streptomyces sp. NPDC048304]|uniref:hypothetical protein n=1 Tax=Streptomyces sp. NPDC048304 TaxID=3154820 RepID=UPI0033D143C2